MNKMRWIIIIIFALSLTGCVVENESMQGCIEKAEWQGDYYYVYFEGGRRYKFNENPPIPLNHGNEVIITTNSCYSNRGNNLFVKVERVNKSQRLATGDITICPRCQYTLRKGIDY